MNNKLLKTGVVGTIIAAICCFTPALVWLMSAIGLAALIVYLDFILLPLLALFVGVLIIGIIARFRR